MTLKGKSACLWHAYNTLVEQSGKNSSIKGKLKVLTQNLASSFHLVDVEQKLDEYFSTDAILFPEYLNFVKKELFQPLIKADKNNANSILSLDQIDKVCWFICSRSYQRRSGMILSDSEIYKLWRLFNSMAETDDEGEANYPVVIDREEAEIVFQKIITIRSLEYKKINFSAILVSLQQLRFEQFLHAVENHVLVDTRSMAGATITELYDDHVLEVLKKGYLQKKGHGITGGWKEFWCVLSLSRICLYSNRDENELKDDLILSKSCKLENLTEKSGISFGTVGIVGVKANRFILNNGSGKVLEMSAPDAQTKTEWLTTLKSALEWTSRESSPKQLALMKRRQERSEKRDRLQKEAEMMRLKEEEIVNALKQLDEEKLARLSAEERADQERAHLLEEQLRMLETQRNLKEETQARERAELLRQEETQLREQEQQRLHELERMKLELEALLEVERQAKHEEEVVRTMQAQILQEEFERREQLESLQAELERMLQLEQLKNIGLEEIRMKQEKIISEEQKILEDLMTEKQKQEQEHQLALTKLQEAERLKAKLEEEFKKKEEQKKNLSNIVSLQLGTHRGKGAFVESDYTVKHNLTPLSPNSQPFHLLGICRTPLSPPVQPDIIRSTDGRSSPPPPLLPPKQSGKRNLELSMRQEGDVTEEQ